MTPKVSYDAEAEAITVVFSDAAVTSTVAYPDDAHLADFGADGELVSLELLSPEPELLAMAERFRFENVVGDIAEAIQRVREGRTATASSGYWQVSGGGTGASTSSSADAAYRKVDLEFA